MRLSVVPCVLSAWLLQSLSPASLPGAAALAASASAPVSPIPAGENDGGRGGPRWADAYAKARRLVGQMTVEEKANVTRGFASRDNVCAGNSGSVPRLRWPGICLHDSGNGVRATDMVSAYPAGLHVGAAWDRALAHRQAVFMAREFKAKGVNVILGPNAGPLGRTPLGGRNWEGFSVDPYLSGQLNAETVSGFQDAGVIANIKHFVGNEQETYRRPYFGVEAASSNIDDRTLHEHYLWPFMDGVRAGVASVMCSYNRVNNTYACNSDRLLNGVLKTELGFEGFVLLDWNAQHGVQSANAGLDMVMPLGGVWGQNLTDAVRDGSVGESRLTDMAKRILAAWYFVGQDKADFPVPGIGMKNLSEPHKAIDARVPESRPVLLDGAISGHVLVKNKDGRALPFRARPAMLSVFGYDAASPAAKNIDTVFQLGYTSSRDIAQAILGTEQHFDQAAKGGTIFVGGRAGANAPPYISAPLSAIQHRAEADGTWVNWDTASLEPDVNGATEACLVFINAMATEGWDRDGLHDDASDGLVRHVASRCANTIVIVHAAGIRLVDRWIEHENVTAAVIAHLPGQDSGRALVRLLYGEANFSGKLPYTLARNESDYPVYAPCGRQDNTTSPQCDYAEGVYLDYRAFDARNVTPRFEFGFGLSYTFFNFSSLVLRPEASLVPSASTGADLWDTLAAAEARVANAGTVAGAEVAQLYLGIPEGPPKQLRGFEKVWLGPGESATVRFALTRRDLSVWDVMRQQWVVRGGEYPVFVGASSRDIRLTGSLVVGD